MLKTSLLKTYHDGRLSQAGRPGGTASIRMLRATVLLLLSGPVLCFEVSADALVRSPQDKPEKKERKSTSSKDSKKSRRSTLSPDAALVKKHLEDYLHPSSIQFLKGKRIQLKFDFANKNEDQETSFIPPIGAGIKAPFRWSQDGEDIFVGSAPGIRISDEGFAMLDCWFFDDVEAHIEVLQHINYSPRMYVAVTFTNEKGRSIGSNYGSQCALFIRGRLAKRGSGDPSGIDFNVKAKLSLVVRDGSAEARKGNSPRAKDKMKYSRESYESGRIGIAWGGSMSATMTSLEVTGKVDIPKMADLLKKKLRL